MDYLRFSTLLMLICLPLCNRAQHTASVHATYTYELGDNDDITLREAKRKCIELAKAQAIRQEFGEMITSDVIDTNVETNGEATSSYFWENTVAMAKGDWLGDTREPVVSVAYNDGRLAFTAEVWGKAREIVQAKTDLQWSILHDADGKRKETDTFNSGERIYIKLKSPAAGYIAVYLIVADDETACLLPYHKESSGRHAIGGGKSYMLFDKDADQSASYYKLKTSRQQEDNQLVLIYSPNPFTKCNDTTGDAHRPNSLSTHDFQKWLLKCQRADRDMVVEKKWVKIRRSKDK